MTTDISRRAFLETRHDVGVHEQMGRVHLDADWNAQVELGLRLQQREGDDVIGTGSADHGFRIADGVVFDAMEDATRWSAQPAATTDPAPQVVVDHFTFRSGRGSLRVFGAVSCLRALGTPQDWRAIQEVRYTVRGSFTPAQCAFATVSGGVTSAWTVTLLADLGSWRRLRAVPTGIASAALQSVDAVGFMNLQAGTQYHLDDVVVDRPVRVPLTRTDALVGWSATASGGAPAPDLRLDDDVRWRDALSVAVTGATDTEYRLPVSRDCSRARALVVAVRSSAGAPTYTLNAFDAATPSAVLALVPAVTETVGGWEIRRYALGGAGLDWRQVQGLRWTGLDSNATYRLAASELVMALDGNFVIMGGDGTSAGAGRFYGNGVVATKERDETYFSQQDLPSADDSSFAEPPQGQARCDLVYLDLWERAVTYIEDPAIREVALEGADTTTRMRQVAQVRVLRGSEVALDPANPPVPPDAAFDAMRPTGDGVLTTKDSPAAALDPCADPCEPRVKDTFVGTQNRLYRVQVHAAGGIGAANAVGTARLLWSSENAAVATPLTTAASRTATTVTVERADAFRIDDLIEIADDLADLQSGPYTGRATTRGELRRITAIDIPGRTISWAHAAPVDPAMHAGLPRAYSPSLHAKIRRWDGLIPATSGDILLQDGVVIELGGGNFLPGDWWTFTARVADRSVERLIAEPPHGAAHRYYRLATITRATPVGGATIVDVRDMRPAFHPLTQLDASDVAFDNSQCATIEPGWDQIDTVQQAIEQLCATQSDEDIRLHNRMLHGFGVVCGLKVKCHNDRELVTIEPGYALDCDGRSIRLRRPVDYEVVREARAAGLLDATGTGQVRLRISRGVNTDADFAIDGWDPLAAPEWYEGTLIHDFYKESIQQPWNTVQQSLFRPFPDRSVPTSPRHQALTSVMNLAFQLVNSLTGKYIYLSEAEHDRLETLYMLLRTILQSETYCAQFDGQTFPAYPWPGDQGMDTAFGLLDIDTRIRLHPGGRYAFLLGTSEWIQIIDLQTRVAVARLEFPAGSNAKVRDVTFNTAGDEAYVVATMEKTVAPHFDSVFATLTLAFDPTAALTGQTWGPTTVVCDHEFVSLAYSVPNLIAVAVGEGLFRFLPSGIPLAPSPLEAGFPATGMLRLDAAGTTAFYSVRTGALTAADWFDGIRQLPLAAGVARTYAATGHKDKNDLVVDGVILRVAMNPTPATSAVGHFNTLSGASAGADTPLGALTYVRLTAPAGRSWFLASLSDSLKAVRIAKSTRTVDTRFRVPLQIYPLGLESSTDGRRVYALNLLGNTVTIIDVDRVIDTAAPPSYTAEPPTALATYRQAALDAFTDLFQAVLQYLKDAFADRFLVDCPTCGPNDQVYLAIVEIRNDRVYHICNWTPRHYVKSFRTYGYWLSTVPVLPFVKAKVKDFFCKIL